MEGVTADSVINAILAHVPVPADGPHRTRRPPRSPGLPPRRHLGTQLDGHPRRQRPLALACACDFALAAPVRHLSLTRSGDTSVRLGETADVTLTVTNPSRRPLRARIRDAWPPAAGSRHRIHRLPPPPDGPTRRTPPPHHPPTPHPSRRPPRRPSDHPFLRPPRPPHPPGHPRGPLGGARPAPFTSRKHLPSKLARLRELDGRTSVLTRGEGTEFDSLREYVPGDDTRSIDWRATARQTTVAVRTWRPERDRHILLVLDTGRTSAGRVGDAPASTPPWTRPCSWQPWHPAPRPRGPPRLRPPGPHPRPGPHRP